MCVCVERKRERERTVSFPRPAYSKIHLSVLQTVCVCIFRFMIGLFSLFCLFGWFCCCFLFFCGCTYNQSRQKKCQRTIFRQTCSIALWTPTPVSNVIPIVFSIPNSISAILNTCWSFTSEFKGLRTKFIRLSSVFALDSRQYRQRFNLFHFL